MIDDGPLSFGLQEWSACCRALTAGSLTLLIRKGGIHERGGGLFAPEHERFALMPTYLHQDVSRLRPAHAGAVDADPQPGSHRIPAWAEVVRTWKSLDLAKIQALGDHLLWTDAELAARFLYRDQPWLFVLLLRVHCWAEPMVIPDHPSYAGCRSWIPLKAALDPAGSTPVLSDRRFIGLADHIAGILD